ncbi:MAG: bifunctional riboflavin kinase/FAD synthetase [Propionibacteriaceae bacterium]|nr:bifunctional riboflavin kinase/FAD synthetase [Propionibacteriaceae bacterium]
MAQTVLAIGNFDGVHRGHQAILHTARGAAEGRPVVAVTFWPHPLAVLRPERLPLLLTELPERIRLLKEAGASQVRVVEFTRQVAAWSPEQFIEATIAPLDPATVVVGRNFRFGHGAVADGSTLADLARGRFDVINLPLLSGPAPLSSSRIRHALADGDPAGAAWMLGRWFRYSGIVVQGDQRGRQLGFPTANLTVPAGHACPKDGVYAGWLVANHGSEPMPAAISVGSNPTFDGVQRRVEAHAIGRTDLELYGAPVGVDFVAHLRDMKRFSGLDELIAQMAHDVTRATDLLASAGPPWAPGMPPPRSLRTPSSSCA